MHVCIESNSGQVPGGRCLGANELHWYCSSGRERDRGETYPRNGARAAGPRSPFNLHSRAIEREERSLSKREIDALQKWRAAAHRPMRWRRSAVRPSAPITQSVVTPAQLAPPTDADSSTQMKLHLKLHASTDVIK